MSKPRSKKFWIIFWSASAVFLAVFYFSLQFKNNPAGTIGAAIDYVPWLSDKAEYKSIAYFGNYLLKSDNREKTFLILFQNNMELRPGGGYIGTFGILKIKNGKIIQLQTNDLSNFDGREPNTVTPPYPMEEALGIKSWKMRDSNWSPDFATNAKKAEYFYYLGQGQEKFDGVVAINTNVLASFLKVTGPVQLDGYPGTYDSENAILTLEYQVEKGYAQQGIAKGERKTVMNALADAIMKKVFTLNASQKIDLAKIILGDLNQKDIQLYFADSQLEKSARAANWAGAVDQSWSKDYLMMVDANLNSFKSDYYIRRSFDYTVDLSGDTPKADLKITYVHTAKLADWMTRDYRSYLRIYVPQGSWLSGSQGLSDIQYGDELGKKYFGSIVQIPIGATRTFELSYNLPKNISTSDYNLLIQKESGVENVPGKITVIGKNGAKNVYNLTLTGDWTLNKSN
ncbi:MAG: DUF4012 domain-containing protein [Candidatus Pacebacteria bacterium]|nr:DUF4012 domain-containing protein [Candidatus Paceibacterota bacterium]MDR3583437.1 DUF4012 domain-containing protein [Candidatus Paceibacterota bacterium]